jgi:CheY-like chemotaxis protein
MAFFRMKTPEPIPRLGADREERSVLVGHRILVVDDDRVTLTYVSEALALLGYKVSALDSSPQALDLFDLNRTSFDLVLTDFNMPELDGLQLSQKLLALQPALPILLMTGGGLALDEPELRSRGLRALLKKPFSLADLDHAIHFALR